MRWRSAAAGVATAAVFTLAAFAWHWQEADRLEQGHADRDETPTSIGVAAPGVRCEIFQAGDSLDHAVMHGACPAATTWLGPGRYFVKATQPAGTSYHPIPVLGYRLGPERDGAFILTVRPQPVQAAPPGFAWIPSGHFLIGDRANPREPHYVWVPAFWIAVFEVTNAEFRSFLGARSGYSSDVNWTEAGRAWRSENTCRASALLRPGDADYRRFGQDDQPVTNVTWFEAIAYCRWRTRQAGQGVWRFTLPTDAEWEKAARGPDGLDYGLSNRIGDAETGLYNWKKNPHVPVTVVGWNETQRAYAANRYGIYHASGNVGEWTASAFWLYNRQRPYSDDRRNNPDIADRRSVRGGSWYSATSAPLYLPYRDAFQPESSGNDLGFRLVAHIRP